MFKRPSSRSHLKHESAELPLVPILDTMVTLIGFLLFTTSFLGVVSIESPLPQIAHEEPQMQQQEKPLQLTLTFKEKEVLIWSPFNKIQSQTIQYTHQGEPDTRGIHNALVEVKKQFPKESSIVLIPNKDASYEILISIMDSVRDIDPTDPPIYFKNESTGVDEPIRSLFPKVIFGNLLGET